MSMAAEADAAHDSDTGDSAIRVRLRPLDEGRELWRGLLGTCPGATLYHRDTWLELLNGAYGLSLWLATLHQDGSVLAGCVFARAPLSRRFISLSFSDACPPLSREPEAAQVLLDALVKQVPARRMYEVRGVGGMARWETVNCFANWRLSLDRPLARIQGALAANFRRNLRRASQQAIRIERGNGLDFLRRFYAMQLESRRRLGLPPQPWHFFKLTRELYAVEGNFEVWLATDKNQDVAGAVFLRDGDVVHYKWGARGSNYRSYANHLLFWNAIEEFARNARILDLGRADVRNQGLMRFKAELGANATPLPCSFYPRAPVHVSAEVLTGGRAVLAGIWRRLPMFMTQLAGRAIYRFLS